MLHKQLILAATAAAFLIVPEVSETDRDIVSTLPIPVDVTDASGMPSVRPSFHLDVPCQQCQGDDARVEMDFAIEDGTRLTLNDFQLYPTSDPWHGDLIAEVGSQGASQEQTLGYSLFIKPEILDAEQRLALVSIDLQILEVGGLFVTGVPKVTAKIIKAPSGEIIIGNVEMEEAPEKGVEDVADNPLVRIKEKVEEFWKKLKSGCGRHRQHGEQDGRVHKYGGKHGARPFRHDHPHTHHHGHHHHHHHNWSRLLQNILASVVLPVLAGITAGVGVAVVTMGLFSCFGVVFNARRRRFCRAARLSEEARSEPAFAEEKAGLMESQDGPPEYDEGDHQTK